MPDGQPGDAINQERPQHEGHSNSVTPPSSPENQAGKGTQQVRDEPEHTDIQSLKDELRTAEKWMIWLTGAIAFFGLCTAGVGVLQWHVMSGQLGEMKNSSTDTRNLVGAAGEQADAAVTSQRPWLKVTATIAGPLVFELDGVRVTVGYRIENTGRSPALRIHLNDRLGAAGSKLPDPYAERLTLCDAARNEPNSGGDTLFPGDHLDIRSTVVMQPDRLRNALIVTSSKDRPRPKPGLPNPIFRGYIVDGEDISKGTIMPEVFGCVDYQFGFAKGHHQTRFVYMISSNGLRIKPSVGTIPASSLSIDPDPRAGIETD